MKKPSQSSKPKKKTPHTSSQKAIAPFDEAITTDATLEEPDLAADQFAVGGREEEASSTGHKVEPIEEDDEHNAEKLIEEGLHGYVRASPNHKSRNAK
jgi:exosome complex RNA-binding protein Rrp42 (RNase PH superfamily)